MSDSAPQFPAAERLDRDAAWQLAKTLGLSRGEFDHIEASLGRLPRRTELSVFAGMWSEHCAYKSTRHLLKNLPRAGAHILAGPGSHAGVVDVGEGWGVAFKIESHNHPSAVDPYQGATTGVGGILRDIIAQGARPCAVMDSLCFGLPDHARQSHLADGIVAGIAGYGNAFGVANMGGKTVYDKRYEGNPLVNALAVGLVRRDAMRTANAAGLGNALVYVGAATGRDGILGAAFASEDLAEDNVESRPHVQVGDPFAGKKLMEACLSFTPAMGMIACQDMGAAGVTCATTEMAAAGNVGLDVQLENIPVREAGMTPQEILLSESQERFMFIVQARQAEASLAHFRSHGVHAAICGKVIAGNRVTVRFHDAVYVDLPAELVAGGSPPSQWPVSKVPLPSVALPGFDPAPLTETLLELLAEPGIADLTPLTDHYDHTVGNRTVRGPGQAAAAVLKLPESTRGFALTITGRGAQCAADPYLGAMAALGEAVRDLGCVGATLCAITDGLNMASPRDPIEMRKIGEVVRGLQDGLTALGVPVTGGNVSLYNESPHGPIPPTPMVGGLGVVDDVRRVPKHGLQVGQVVFLAGGARSEPVFSRFSCKRTGIANAGVPAVDLPAEQKLAAFLVQQVKEGRIRTAKPGSLGGLGVAMAKLCAHSKLGVRLRLPATHRLDWLLFGEYPASAWIIVDAAEANAVEAAAQAAKLPLQRAGMVTQQPALVIEDGCEVPVQQLAQAYGGVHA